MSRVGKLPIAIPSNVKLDISKSNLVTVEGPKGKLDLMVNPRVEIEQQESQVVLNCKSNEKKHKSLFGLYRVLINNMVTGVSKGFERRLEIIGTGYKAQVSGNKLIMNLGFSHPIDFEVPDGIKIAVEDNTKLVVSGIDKQLVGQVSANIRKFRPPEPYKGKGVKYANEVIRRKAGKAAKK